MLKSVANFISTLESKEIKYTHYPKEENRKEIVKISYTAKHNNSLSFYFFFDDDGESINLKIWDICKVSEEKMMEMYVVLNEINYEYRWVKLYIDKDNEVTASGDAIIDENTAGEECCEILGRYLSILDDVYPRLMKVLWA